MVPDGWSSTSRLTPAPNTSPSTTFRCTPLSPPPLPRRSQPKPASSASPRNGRGARTSRRRRSPRFQGRMLLVPSSAVVHDAASTYLYVQHTPERFELRQVTVGQTFGSLLQVTNGLRDGDRVVVRGADKMPRQ